MNVSGRIVEAVLTALLAFLLVILVGCGGSSSSTPASTGALSGNWQVNLVQDYPLPVTNLSVSGFVVQSSETLTGNVEVPTFGTLTHCGGVAPLTGTVNGQSVTFSLNEGGTVVNFTGTLGSDGTSMTGSYQAAGGACFPGTSTTGTWSSFLVPPLNGSFTGTIDSTYMAILTGATTAVPVNVSGTMTQSSNAGASNATLTGTITAVNYPCFTTATLTGTISGQNVYLNVYGYNGEQIGTLGQPSSGSGTVATPALVMINAGAISLVDANQNGMFLGVTTKFGETGPCPPITASGQSFPDVIDGASVMLSFFQ